MNLISNDGIKFSIEDKYINYSPFLLTLKNTDLHKDVDEEGNYIVMYDLTHYITFLREGTINSFDPEIFDYMGHENTHEYPDEFFKVRLEDRWIRDNMYKYGLIEDQLYGLKNVKIVNKIEHNIYESFPGCKPIIAGGAALYMAGGTDKYSDIDVFFVGDDCDRVKKILNKNKKKYIFNERCATHKKYGFQVIFRKYNSISEIVHGFDLDCCGYLLYEEKLYATNRSHYSLTHKVNWFDPDRMSPSYVYRLCKYAKRGYEIMLPGISTSNFNYDLFYKNGLRYMNSYNNLPIIEIVPDLYNEIYDMITKLGCKCTLDNVLLLILIDKYHIDPEKRQSSYVRCHKNIDLGKQVNILLIAKFRSLYPGTKISDYQGKKTKLKEMPKWLEQDPMTQITSTFNPEPITNIRDYYSKSDYYINLQ